MNCYEELNLKTIINASEPYTNLGGSLMEEETVRAMQEAGRHFVDYEKLRDAVCERAARLTNNKAAFVTTGAAAGLELSAAACMCIDDARNMEKIPHTETFKKKEIIVLDGMFLDMIPYWKLLNMAGAEIVRVSPDKESIRQAICERTAACVLFPAPIYEKGILPCEEVIPIMKEHGVRVIVDAAAQLPPTSNLWYYTKELGADLAVFSGGKHIKGPQCTGLIVGEKELIDLCKDLSCPNPRLGRPFKTGKEELAGFIKALELFVSEDEDARFQRQEKQLDIIEEIVTARTTIRTKRLKEGRLGTYQPLLLLYLPDDQTAADCNKYTRKLADPVDVGVYPPEFEMPDNLVFINAYNLKQGEELAVAEAICSYMETNSKMGGN